MGKYIARVICTSFCFVLLSLIIFIAPALALEVDVGQQIELKAKNAAGIPLHESSQPSLFGRAPDKAKATVLGFDDQKHWIEIQLSDDRKGWIIERYVGNAEPYVDNVDNIVTASSECSPVKPIVDPSDIDRPEPIMPSGSVILPGQSGGPLLEKLSAMYSPLKSVGYRKARDLLYSQIDNEAGIVEGIYSGYRAKISQTSGQPRQDATSGGINAEHVWPQSRGAKGAAKSDMHHLFPARMEVNSVRGNHPFADIPDDQTKFWYLNDQKKSGKPSPQVIDLYSESYSQGRNGKFEPRESKKGDVARAMFYFQTIYPNRADDFFNPQKDTLCGWAEEDPIDSGEVERSHKIANTAQGNENPFVLDPTLPQRTYCN